MGSTPLVVSHSRTFLLTVFQLFILRQEICKLNPVQMLHSDWLAPHHPIPNAKFIPITP